MKDDLNLHWWLQVCAAWRAGGAHGNGHTQICSAGEKLPLPAHPPDPGRAISTPGALKPSPRIGSSPIPVAGAPLTSGSGEPEAGLGHLGAWPQVPLFLCLFLFVLERSAPRSLLSSLSMACIPPQKAALLQGAASAFPKLRSSI